VEEQQLMKKRRSKRIQLIAKVKSIGSVSSSTQRDDRRTRENPYTYRKTLIDSEINSTCSYSLHLPFQQHLSIYSSEESHLLLLQVYYYTQQVLSIHISDDKLFHISHICYLSPKRCLRKRRKLKESRNVKV